MGKHQPLQRNLNQDARMIDTTTKQQGGVGMAGEREKSGKKTPVYSTASVRKHSAINLPKNLMDSDSEDYEEENSSEDDNDFVQNDLLFSDNGTTNQKLEADQVTRDLQNLTLDKKKNTINKLVEKLSILAKKYQESVPDKHKGLKARSPYRNRINEHRQKPFDRHDMTVTTPHGNVGRVFVQSLAPSIISEPPVNIPKDNMLLDAIQDKDFIASFIDLSSDEAEQVFLKFIEPDSQLQRVEPYDREIHVVPQDVVVPHSVMSPNNSLTPQNSPNNVDFYDSSYETGSPGSTVVTSPGSPGMPRSSVSSESDQELDPAMETLPPAQANIVIIPATVMPKSEPKMKPLGEVVNYVSTSASQRLYELSKSTSFCVKHFTIQLVRVVMTTKAENSADRIEEFSKSLMNTMKTRILNKPHEGDIWQLSIYAHIQFLTAPDRMMEYRSALMSRDERSYPPLYIAAIERYEKPLIARYITESMSQVGYSPLEPMDEKGNTILHLVAEQGDSHIHVLSELLMATGANNKPLLSVHTPNSSGQSPLHISAKSTRPQLTTLLHLLKMGARPFDLDHCQMTALHYYIQGISSQAASYQSHRWEELEVVRKMLQAPMSLSKESLQVLEKLRTDPATPSHICNLIAEEVNRNSSKDLRTKKIERRSPM